MCALKSAGELSGFTISARERPVPREKLRKPDLLEAGRVVRRTARSIRPWFVAIKRAALKSLSFLVELFRRDVAMKQFSCATKPFFVFGADIRKQRVVIKSS